MNSDQKKQQFNSYARYSGMGLQMLIIILAGVFGGYKLDQWLHTGPLLIIILSIISVVISIYSVTRDLLRKK
ncbi:MAG TPA: AtpZ/AtpI family protein [Bacteroidales bacterium]|nr:AtpZ/AtpI family protein [Bacteroidales bacterium]